MSDRTFAVELVRASGYRFQVTSEREGGPGFQVDEAPPLGEGNGPTPTELLGAAIGGCLGASLVFCLDRSRVPVEGIRTRVEGTLERNEAGRLRVGGIRVQLQVDLPEPEPRGARCLDLFQDFCIVKESVRAGIPIEVQVVDRDGRDLMAEAEPAGSAGD